MGDGLLLAPTHNGFGNQMFGLEKALWLALCLNRTLVVPPMLQHSHDRLGFESWPRSSCEKTEAYVKKAFKRYDAIVDITPTVSRWTRLVNFTAARNAGARIIDYADVRGRPYEVISKLSCNHRPKGKSCAAIRDLVGNVGDFVALGSAMPLDLAALKKTIPETLQPAVEAAHVLPFHNDVQTIADTIAVDIDPFVAVHLRAGQRKKVVEAMDDHLRSQTLAGNNITAFIASDSGMSFDYLRSLPFCDHHPCLDQHFLLNNATSPGPSGRFFRRHSAHEVWRKLHSLFPADFLSIALDQELAARSRALFLTDSHLKATFRKTSTFAMILRRRWVSYHQSR